MRKALVVGINDYPEAPLEGCVNDANAIATTLETHGDGSPNFGVKLITTVDTEITRSVLRESIDNLFSGESDMALLYFSGHGQIVSTGGFLVTQDAKRYDEGVSMDEVLTMANQSPAKNKIIILDCCHSGALGSPTITGSAVAQLSEGLSVLTASRDSEYAMEVGGAGIFTTLVIAALTGGAADLRGYVTPGALYAYIDQALGAWDQRPIFKTNVSTFASLRDVEPRVPLKALRKISSYFDAPDAQFKLDPSYEYTHKKAKDEHVAVFKELQKFQSVGLVEPVDEDYMYFAAINSTACKLTPVGRQYWRLAQEKKL